MISIHATVSNEDVLIRCEKQSHDAEPEGYPVLFIGDVTIFPSLKQLAKIREVADEYLTAEAGAVEDPLSPANVARPIEIVMGVPKEDE